MSENITHRSDENGQSINDGHPAWMDDPSIAYVPKEKIAFLSKLMAGTKDLSKNGIMQYLPKLVREAREQNIRFSHEEMNDIIAAIRNHSTDEERRTIDKVLSSKPL